MYTETIKKCSAVFSNGVVVVNTTPHPITFLDGEEVKIVPSSVPVGEKTGALVLDAKAVETRLNEFDVKTLFEGTEAGFSLVKEIEASFPEEAATRKLKIIGSIIAAQAYAGTCVRAMCPAKGFERVPPAEKRMAVDKFTAF